MPTGGELAAIEGRLPEPLRRRLAVEFAEIDNPGIMSLRPPGDRFVRFTGRRHCDCGVPLACSHVAEARAWWYGYGKTKGRYNLYERVEREARRRRKEAGRWLSLFRYLLGDVGNFGLLLHEGHDLEQFTFNRTEPLDVEAVTPEGLILLEREVTYEVVR